MSLAELFEEHHESLFRFTARMTGDPELAQDIVQETFLNLARRPPTDGSTSRAWIFQTARNLALSDLRKQERRRKLLERGRHDVPSGTVDRRPDEHAERAETRARVRHALLDLSEKERTVLLMREEGFKHREIAEAVGTTTASVGTMLARALEKLERRLDVGAGRTP